MNSAEVLRAPGPKKLDLGCGRNKKEGFFGIDSFKFDNVDLVLDLGNSRWPFDDDSVEEVHCSHFLEHLTQQERIHFANELYRVMAPGAKAQVITPHWASSRAYGDPTHRWPPVSEMFNYYLKREWREANAPHTDIRWNPDGFSCDFDVTWAYSLHPLLMPRNQELQQMMLNFAKEAAQDMAATWAKPLRKD